MLYAPYLVLHGEGGVQVVDGAAEVAADNALPVFVGWGG